MPRSTKVLALASALVAGLALVPALYAHESERSRGSTMGPGMMGPDNQMMDGCNKMMQSMRPGGSGLPNEQWRQDAPETDRTPGADG